MFPVLRSICWMLYILTCKWRKRLETVYVWCLLNNSRNNSSKNKTETPVWNTYLNMNESMTFQEQTKQIAEALFTTSYSRKQYPLQPRKMIIIEGNDNYLEENLQGVGVGNGFVFPKFWSHDQQLHLAWRKK